MSEYSSQIPRHPDFHTVSWSTLDGRCVSSVSETGPDTPVYPVYLTVTKLLLMRCVSSVSEAGADTQCIWCIWGPQPVYLPSRWSTLGWYVDLLFGGGRSQHLGWTLDTPSGPLASARSSGLNGISPNFTSNKMPTSTRAASRRRRDATDAALNALGTELISLIFDFLTSCPAGRERRPRLGPTATHHARCFLSCLGCA